MSMTMISFLANCWFISLLVEYAVKSFICDREDQNIRLLDDIHSIPFINELFNTEIFLSMHLSLESNIMRPEDEPIARTG